jgi:hypothetical protein
LAVSGRGVRARAPEGDSESHRRTGAAASPPAADATAAVMGMQAGRREPAGGGRCH